MIKVERRYFEYLLRECGLNKARYKNLLVDFKDLFDVEYHAVLKRDETRIMDVMTLRKRFINYDREYGKGECDQNDYDDLIRNYCNVFELFCALAIRMDLEIVGTAGVNNSGMYVIDMIRNIGNGDIDVKNGAIRWVNRNFRSDGLGSPFPLRNCGGRDMRNVELWDQMQAYVRENIDENGDFVV